MALTTLQQFLAYRATSIRAYVPFLLYFLESKGLSLTQVFDLNVVFVLASLFLELPSGMYADRFGRRNAMVLAGVLMALACGSFVLGHGFAAFALANVFCAASMTLNTSADSAWLFEYMNAHNDSERYQQFEGYSTAAKSVGNLFAMLLAGLLYSVVSWGPFALTAALTVSSAALARRLPEQRAPKPSHSALRELRRTLGRVSSSSELLLVIAFGALTFTVLQLSLFVDPAHLALHLRGFSLAEIALAVAVLSASKELFTALASLSLWPILERVKIGRVVVGLAACAVTSFVLMGRMHDGLCIATMLLIAGLFGVFQPLVRRLLNTAIEDSEHRATMFSVESTSRRVVFALASALFGRAAESSTLHSAFRATAWIAAICYGLVAMGALGWLRFLRKTPKQKDPLLSYL
jgi:MFS family permease